MPRRRRIHDDIHRERDHRTRPCVLGLAEQEIHRDGQAVIDFHLVDDCEVELIENDGLRDVRGKLAAPMAGTCDEPTPAMIFATTHFRFVRDLDFALLLTLAALSRPDLLRLPSTERPPASIISAYSFGVDPVMRAAMRSNE